MKAWQDKNLPEIIILEPDIFNDHRGYFLETYQVKRYNEFGIKDNFVQDNLSFSKKGVLRGLHYQFPKEQAKLVQVIHGEIFDVAVDIRRGSPSFGKWTSVILSGQNGRQIYIPAGFAHGFCVLSETAHVLYKCSESYSPATEGGILWSDPEINIKWPVESPVLSHKDSEYPRLCDIPEDKLPPFSSRD